MTDLADTVKRFVRAIAGGDPQENRRRYEANQELTSLTYTQPWTEEALRESVREWLGGGEPEADRATK